MQKIIFISIIFLLGGCLKDSYSTQVYDKQLINKQIECLKLELLPYSTNIFNTTKSLYKFRDSCKNILQIKYKTDIVCNSKYNTNKQLNSFIQLNILIYNKLIYMVYKDLDSKDDIEKEIQKGYNRLCKTIKL